ncbi:MAG: mechanosensitive ion channel family protein [Phaeodactylibacter sp.]|nr:mechanosensitive ion channel family protein [Phaeodactylibacter sp.]
MIKRLVYRLLAGLTVLLAAPVSLLAQGEPSNNWANFVENLKNFIPGSMEDPFLDKLKENPGLLIQGFIALPIVLGSTYLITRVLKWLINQAADRSNRYRVQWLRAYPIIRLITWLFAIGFLLQLLMREHWGILLLGIVIVVGFSAKDGLKDLLGGLWLTIERPFSVGDRITVGGYYGEVKDIGLRATTINTLDDSMVTIPNSYILSNSVSNVNSGENNCMVVTDLWLPIAVDVAVVRKIAYEAVISSPYLNLDKPVKVLVIDHFRERLATVVKVKAYVLDSQYEKLFESDVTEAAKQAFCREGVYGNGVHGVDAPSS